MQRYISFGDRSPFKNLQLLVYYVQRIMISRRLRKVGTHLLRCVLRLAHPSGKCSHAHSHLTSVLFKDGFLPLGQALTPTQCQDIHEYLADKILVDNRGRGNTFQLAFRPPGTKLADYSLETVVNCPHILGLANELNFINLATEYLGFTPTITNLALRWSFPADGPAGEVQAFHRDSEIGTFKILIYLTDVDLASGPHMYVLKTHHDRMTFRMRLYTDQEIDRQYKKIIVVTGLAGTAFAIDTKGIHKGVPPLERARLLLGIQYSLLPCLLYDYVPVRHTHRKPFDTYVNRLIVRANDLEAHH